MTSVFYESNLQQQKDCLIAEKRFQSSVLLIKYFFDQVSFRLNAVSIKCRFDQKSFQSSVVSIKCLLDQLSFD